MSNAPDPSAVAARSGRGGPARRAGARAAAPARAPLPPLSFPEALPVSARRDEIAAAIRAHPVVVVCGETGSGKTTQLPKICALAGRGTAGLIAHTQPRRLAATSVARRIAEELGSPLGEHVGYRVRFNEQVSPRSTIHLLTDGLLLAETQSDPHLSRYDTIIVDEAHERSLNIDVLLGYLRQLLDGPRADDLRVVITSATLDAERFARHFGRRRGEVLEPAPVIEVSGRLYPIEVRWQPPEAAARGPAPGGPATARDGPASGRRPDGGGRGRRDDDDESDLPSAIEAAIEGLWSEAPGDVLVFLPGEREIRDAADHLRRAVARAGEGRGGAAFGRGPVEVLPLYARLSAADQRRVFGPSRGRRIVLATNVAETSLTVPGIRYVVDSGLARVKRYRYRGKVDALRVEPVSQAAANQRAGRCGRVMNGVAVRLYAEDDFAARPRFTDPEVLRSSLAGVILRMKALHLDDVEAFPFVDPPPRKAVADGVALLHELGALDESQALTAVGRQLARLPVDPRIGRMLLAGHQGGCLAEVLVIAAALSTEDPRERPPHAQQAADERHRRFADETSDFLAILKLWQHWQVALEARASNRLLAQSLEREFLSVRKLREWTDVHRQLADAVAELGWRPGTQAARPETIHRALLAGLLGNLGFLPADEPLYQGTHEVRFAIHPSSGLGRKAPRWLMAAEMVDTGRLYARTVARIDPAWIETAAGHLIRRSTGDAHWERSAGQAITLERGVLYGLTLWAQRRVPLAPRDPALARDTLIRHALVAGDVDARAWPGLRFVEHNRRLIAEIERLEHQARRPDLLVDEAFLRAWFDARVPADVTSMAALAAWYRDAVRGERDLLCLKRDELLRRDAEGVDSAAFPRRLTMRGVDFDLDYRFEPGAADDGVTLVVPVHLLNQVDSRRCEWLVPGLLREKAATIARSLPPKLRRHVAPIADWAQAFASAHAPAEGTLLESIRADLRERLGVSTSAGDFRLETVPVHLSMAFRLVDAHGAVIAMSRNLAELRAQFGARAQSSFQAALQQVAGRIGTAPAGGPGVADPDGGDVDGGDVHGVAVHGSSGGGSRGRGAGAGSGGTPTAAATATGDGVELLRRAGERHQGWTFGPLPELMELRRGDETLVGWPALLDVGDAVELQVFDTPEAAQRVHGDGLARLFAIALREPLRFLERQLPEASRLQLLFAPFGDAAALRAQLARAVIERTCLSTPWPNDSQAFAARLAEARPRVALVGQETARTLLAILAEHATLSRKLPQARAVPAAHADLEAWLASLLPPRFLVETPAEQLGHLPRYLKAAAARVDKLRADPARDARAMVELSPLLAAWRRATASRRGERDAGLESFRWQLEELRVGLFAQELRTAYPVSARRLAKVWESLAR